ncbi:hypothetical protein HDU76_010426, partial [Blyttiomyces sp. JEL0837]
MATSYIGMKTSQEYHLEGRVCIIYTDKLAIVNAYIPNGTRRQERQTYKELFLNDLETHCKKLGEHFYAIIAADLNIAPTQQDIHENSE